MSPSKPNFELTASKMAFVTRSPAAWCGRNGFRIRPSRLMKDEKEVFLPFAPGRMTPQDELWSAKGIDFRRTEMMIGVVRLERGLPPLSLIVCSHERSRLSSGIKG